MFFDTSVHQTTFAQSIRKLHILKLLAREPIRIRLSMPVKDKIKRNFNDDNIY
jgi:hypothetical protein